MKRPTLAKWLAWLPLLFGVSAVAGEHPARDDATEHFLRVNKDDQNQLRALETSVVSYAPADDARDGLVIDLIGAVHVGEASYYKELNKRFTNYDVVLYELVAPEGVRPKSADARRPANAIGAMQVGMKSMLELEFQLEHIDYTRDNLVHADMSPDEFAKSMKDRGESMAQMFFRMMGQSIAIQSRDPGKTGDIQLFSAFFAKNRALRLKRVFAEQIIDAGGFSAFDGPDGSTIITERNKKALDVLRDQLKKGKKRIAIFYGAGHLPDFHRRLTKEFRLKKVREQWLVAWNLQSTGNSDDDNDGEARPEQANAAEH